MPELQNEVRDGPNLPHGALQTIDVGGVPFCVSNLDHAVDWLLGRVLDKREGISIRLANSYCVALTNSDERYMRLMTRHGVNFPDGMPVALVMRMVSKRYGLLRSDAGRVRGPSFFVQTLDQGRREGVRHFFLGTTPETLARLQANVEIRYPGITITGSYAPPFAPVTEAFVSDCAARVNASNADIVWVGLGTPKQDFLTLELAKLTSRHCVGVGAAFDFAAGTAREAPKWIQDSGLEWLYRFILEPRRLWKRYLVGNFQFSSMVIKKNLL